MLEPTGPLPPQIYWRRRALGVGVVVVVLLLLVWIISSIGGGDDAPDPAAAAASSSITVPSAASTTATDSGGGSSNNSGGGSESVSASGSTTAAAGSATPGPPVPPGQCPDQSLAIKSTVEHPTYQIGQEPVFGIVITNISTTPCERDLGAGLQQALVYTIDGAVRLWANSDCFPNTTADVRTLTPGQQAAFTVKWSGTTSAPECAGERTPVTPGAYIVVAQLGALRSAPEPFNVA